MTAVSVRCVFEEIHSERVVARDCYDYKDSTFSAAKFLWATWKAQQVMDRYIKHQFYEHPSIAAVLARHLADNYVKPDDTIAHKLTKLEKDHKALLTRVDSLSTREKHKGEKNDRPECRSPRELGCLLRGMLPFHGRQWPLPEGQPPDFPHNFLYCVC
jgi:hypothetical protein